MASIIQVNTIKDTTATGVISVNTSGTITVPNATDTLVGKATTDTLTNKTLTAPTLTTPTSSSPTFTGTITFPSGSIASTGKLTAGGTTVNHVIENNSTGNGVLLVNNNDTTTGSDALSCVVLRKGSTTATTSQHFVQFELNAGGTASGFITANGANTAAFTTSSDERLKDNIVNLPSQLSNICSLRPVEFDYKDGSGHQIGFIAQEVQAIYPDVISEDNKGFLMLSGMSKMESRFIKAFQELKAECDSLRSELKALKKSK